MPIRIGVNALFLKPGAVGGTEVYLRNLLAAIAKVDQENLWTIFANSQTGRDLLPPEPNFRWAPQPISGTFRPGRILYEQLVLPLRTGGIDVLFNPGFTAPVWGVKNVTVFHDLQHYRHPEHFRWYDLPFWNLLLWASAKRSTRLITVSQSTHDDVLKHFHRDSTIINHGVAAGYFEVGERRRPGKVLLCVSTTHPHKNHLRLLRAFNKLCQLQPGYTLVLTGVRGFAANQVEDEVRRLGLNASVRVTGWIPQAELYDLYAEATGAIYPSTFEGFGMPVLEAMAAQVPLACSNIEPLHELVDGTAIEFDPHDETAIAAALDELVRNPPPHAPALARARQFSWERAALETIQVLTDC